MLSECVRAIKNAAREVAILRLLEGGEDGRRVLEQLVSQHDEMVDRVVAARSERLEAGLRRIRDHWLEAVHADLTPGGVWRVGQEVGEAVEANRVIDGVVGIGAR